MTAAVARALVVIFVMAAIGLLSFSPTAVQSSGSGGGGMGCCGGQTEPPDSTPAPGPSPYDGCSGVGGACGPGKPSCCQNLRCGGGTCNEGTCIGKFGVCGGENQTPCCGTNTCKNGQCQ